MNTLHYVTCSIIAVSNLSAAEPATQHTRSSYSQDALIAARVAWLWQEVRIGQLKYEAREIAKTTPMQ